MIPDVFAPYITVQYSTVYYKLGQDFMGPLQVWPMVCGCRGSKNVTYRQQTRYKKVNTEPL